MKKKPKKIVINENIDLNLARISSMLNIINCDLKFSELDTNLFGLRISMKNTPSDSAETN